MDLQILVGLSRGKDPGPNGRRASFGPTRRQKDIGVLEKEAATALFHCDGRRMRLTSTGHHVADRAKNVLVLLDEIDWMVAGQHSTRGGFVRILAQRDSRGLALPTAIGEFLLLSGRQSRIGRTAARTSVAYLNGGAFDLAVIGEKRFAFTHPLSNACCTNQIPGVADTLVGRWERHHAHVGELGFQRNRQPLPRHAHAFCICGPKRAFGS